MIKVNCASVVFLHLLLFLLFIAVSPNCQRAPKTKCQKHPDFVPGYSLAGEGFDITKLEKKGSKVLDMNQWQKPDGSCILCQNLLLEEKPLQRLPLAAADWKTEHKCEKKVRTSLQSSGISVVQSAASDVKNDWKIGLNVPVKPQINVQVAVAGSHSKVADFSIEKSSRDKYTFASHEVSCSHYSFHVGHFGPLSPHFKLALKNLPKRYHNTSRVEYRQLIETYGTHFITHLHLGGRVRDVTALRVCETVMDGVTADEIKDCLNIEAAASIGGDKVKMDSAYKTCEELKKKKSFKSRFYQKYQERHTEIVGGNSHIDLLFSDNPDKDVFKEWLESLKSTPDLLSYSLQPIHNVVPKDDPKREGLRQAVSEYVTERALWRNCSHPCPPGTQRSLRDPCSCVCHNSDATDATCCPRKRGQGRLTVTIKRANGLWGDIFSRTDAYVKVFYQGIERRTTTIWNNDNPVWNTHLDFGNVHVMGETSTIRVQVWDDDNWKNDDLLGSCDRTLQAGKPHVEVCYCAHGRLEFHYHLVCGPYLGGPYCFDYVPQQPKYLGALLQRKGKADPVKSKAP